MQILVTLRVFAIYFLTTSLLTGCSVGFLLFYRDSKTTTIYRSSTSKINYYVIKATTLSHCGCTDLNIEYYKNGKPNFNLFYNGNIARKTIFEFDAKLKVKDTISLITTSSNDYTTPFDSLDIEIFNRIDSIALQKPKGLVYQIKRPIYKGYINDPFLNY